MDNPRPEKIAVIEEVRERLDRAAGSVVTEYRGLTVAELAALRRSLSAAGGEYKVFKNTLVRRAIADSAHAPLEDLLTGPTAIAFVHGDVSAVAKALRDFSRANAHLVVKGGLLDGAVLSPAQLQSLADLPSREVLLGRMAGAIQAPLTQLAGLIQALPRNLAYGLKALLDQQGGAPAETDGAGAEAQAQAPAAETAAEAPAAETDGAGAEAQAPAAETAESAEAAAPSEEPGSAPEGSSEGGE